MKLQRKKMPAWAKTLVARVCELEYAAPIAEHRFTWNVRAESRTCCTGCCWAGREIQFNEGPGAPLTEKKVVLLHELAHWFAPRGAGHGDRFYDVFYRYLSHFGLYRAALKRDRPGPLRRARQRALVPGACWKQERQREVVRGRAKERWLQTKEGLEALGYEVLLTSHKNRGGRTTHHVNLSLNGAFHGHGSRAWAARYLQLKSSETAAEWAVKGVQIRAADQSTGWHLAYRVPEAGGRWCSSWTPGTLEEVFSYLESGVARGDIQTT